MIEIQKLITFYNSKSTMTQDSGKIYIILDFEIEEIFQK